MRSSILFGCVGLLSIAVAGCGVLGRYGDCPTCGRPAPRMVARNKSTPGTVVASSSTRPAGIASSQPVIVDTMDLSSERDHLPPIPPLPVAKEKDHKDQDEPAMFKVEVMPTDLASNKASETSAPVPGITVTSQAEKADIDPKTKEGTINLKSTHIQFGRTDGFKSVTGQVQMWKRTVRVRYAPVDQEDTYGGFVILEGGSDVTRLRDGQHVRIRGVLIQPEERNGSAHYRVQGIEILD